MADRTKIEWTDASWNPVVGCTQVSAGCDHCYAKRVTERFHGPGSFDEVKLHPTRLEQPLRWKRPRRIFVNSMSDLFHDDIPDEYIARVFAVMAAAPQHTFQVLTKRHGRLRSLVGSERFRDDVLSRLIDLEQRMDVPGFSWPLPNVWLGVSVEDQRWADIRIPALLDTPAAVRFLSCEPLLGPIDRLYLTEAGTAGVCYDIDGGWWHQPGSCPHCRPRPDWVIVGGESGPGARPMHPAWARNLLDQCVAARVPFLFKQWGEWAPARDWRGPDHHMLYDGRLYGPGEVAPDDATCVALHRWGKKAAGRELAGRTWDEYPSGGA